MTTDTRHLDVAIAILGGGKKRKKRSKATVINLYDLGPAGVSVQVNGREIEVCPTHADALEYAFKAGDVLIRAGRTVHLQDY